MELKEFINQTISEIATAMIESQSELKDKKVIINPKYTVKDGNRHYLATEVDANGRTEVSELSFDLALEVSDSESGSKGIGIASVLQAGASKSSEQGSTITQRISFTVPVVFPSGNPEQVKPRKHGPTTR